MSNISTKKDKLDSIISIYELDQSNTLGGKTTIVSKFLITLITLNPGLQKIIYNFIVNDYEFLINEPYSLNELLINLLDESFLNEMIEGLNIVNVDNSFEEILIILNLLELIRQDDRNLDLTLDEIDKIAMHLNVKNDLESLKGKLYDFKIYDSKNYGGTYLEDVDPYLSQDILEYMDQETVYQICKKNKDDKFCMSKDDPFWIRSLRERHLPRLIKFVNESKGSPFEIYSIYRYLILKKLTFGDKVLKTLDKDTDRSLNFYDIESNEEYELLDDLDNITTLEIGRGINKKMYKDKESVNKLILNLNVDYDKNIIKSLVDYLPNLNEIEFVTHMNPISYIYGSPRLLFQSLGKIPENFHGNIKYPKFYEGQIENFEKESESREKHILRKLEDLEISKRVSKNVKVLT